MLELLVVLVVVCVVLYLVNAYVPAPPPIKTALNVLVLLVLVVWILRAFNIVH